jgi:flavin reductase (DIM6/NTAB) family NADH-FMN oxidoreductase RutF
MPQATVREAFAQVATNVAVITVPGPHGSTANVWAEAPDPPVLLVTLRRGGDTHRRVTEGGRFGVNLLAEEQAPLARQFAQRRGDRFAGVELEDGETGLPLLAGALATFECAVRAEHWFGAHDIVVGDVLAAHAAPERRPLIFAAGGFHATTPIEVLR